MKKILNQAESNKTAELQFREKFIPLAGVTAMIVMTILIIKPMAGKVMEQRKYLNARKAKFEVMSKKLTTLQDMNEAVLEEQAATLEKIFPSRKPAFSLLLALSRLAQKSNVSLSTIELVPGKVEPSARGEGEESSKEAENFPFEFSIEGGFEEALSFIGSLGEIAPIIKIDEFSMSSDLLDSQAWENDYVKISLKVTAFYQAIPETLPALDAPIISLSDKETKIMSKLDEFLVFGPVEPTAQTGKEDLFSAP